MTLTQAFNKKLDILANRVSKMDKRSNPRIPHKLQWIGSYFSIFLGKVVPPKGCISFYDIATGSTDVVFPLDKLARSFCALEDFEDWLNKVDEGSKKHQQEMEKQAENKITRFQTFASIGFLDRKDEQEETSAWKQVW